MAAPSSDEAVRPAALVLPSAGDVETLVSAHGTHYAVTNRNGDVVPPGARELGFFVDDTRHLSHYELELEGLPVVHLSADSIDPTCNRVDLMLAGRGDQRFLDDPAHFLHIRRRQLVDDGFSDEIRFVNYLQRQVEITIAIRFAADFADVFEVRGAKRPRRGLRLAPVIDEAAVQLAYGGLDGNTYTTRVMFSPTPNGIGADHAIFRLVLEPGRSTNVEVRVETSASRPAIRRRPRFDERVRAKARSVDVFRAASTQFRCDNEMIQQVLEQAATDLHALSVDVAGHRTLAAGIPWFCCPFGRDTLLASYEALTLNPDLATSSLRALAAMQGTKFDDYTEEEPGRILHELRFGEMASCKEIPHLPYFGSIDATPLFLIVAHATYKVTSDLPLVVDLQAAIHGALSWIDRRSACGTRIVTYDRRSPRGLDNQGWKDSRAGVSFPDGRRAESPIALCEVQGYCADAYRRGAHLLRALGEEDAARTYEERAAAMCSLIERTFWLPDEMRYAFAIDGHQRALQTIVSNLGHLLWSRVAEPTRARATADLLMRPESRSGFGIRTLAAGQPVYNPLSYHNGTVWPHDNALIAKGFANYGFAEEACTVFEALIAAMAHFRDRRLPELFCGMSPSPKTLVRYPVACSPQAWSAAAPFLLLQAVLGLHIDGPAQRVTIRNPRIPRTMTRLEMDRLRVGSSRISLRIRRVGKRCHVDRFDIEGAPLRTSVELG